MCLPTVVGVLNERFRQALSVCKDLSSSGPVSAVDSRTSTITADKLIYNYAIEMVSNVKIPHNFKMNAFCAENSKSASE